MSATPPAPSPSPSEIRAAARALVDTVRLGAEAFGRRDRASIQAAALARIDRPETLIAVIGEFKQGKSSLVNALIETDAAPVDDDLATAVPTLFRYRATPGAVVVRESDGKETREAVPFDGYAAFVREDTNRENVQGIARVEVELPNRFLQTGAVLLDTPGFGGLAMQYGGATLACLRSVDAVIFASDCSAPLSRSEVDFLRRAVEACPAVLMALTKKDLYPEWQAMEQLANATVASERIEVPILAVSSVLAAHCRRTGDRAAMSESRVGEIVETLTSLVVDPARLHACQRGMDESRETIRQLRAASSAELAALEDPNAIEQLSAELAATRSRLEQLRGSGSRWSQLLGDGFSDLIGEADFHFRGSMREVTRNLEDEIESGGDPGRTWDQLNARLRERVGAAADRMVDEIDDGARAIQSRIASLLSDEEGLDLHATTAARMNVDDVWATKPLERVGVGKAADLAFSGLRGGQSGISTIKLVASLAGFGVSTTATFGVGFVFVGKQLLDERKRHLQAKRQQARTAVRQFADDVQFEASKRMRDLVRDLQRAQRDYFSERIAELQRTAAESLDGVQAAAQKSVAEREAGASVLRQRLGQLDQLEARLAQIEALL